MCDLFLLGNIGQTPTHISFNVFSYVGKQLSLESDLDLPEVYDKRYKVNISLKSKDAKTLKKLLCGKGSSLIFN